MGRCWSTSTSLRSEHEGRRPSREEVAPVEDGTTNSLPLGNYLDGDYPLIGSSPTGSSCFYILCSGAASAQWF